MDPVRPGVPPGSPGVRQQVVVLCRSHDALDRWRLRLRATDRILDMDAEKEPHAPAGDQGLSGADAGSDRSCLGDAAQVARAAASQAVSLAVGWADRLPCADDAFDVVVSCNMLTSVARFTGRCAGAGSCALVALVITDWCDELSVLLRVIGICACSALPM